MIKKNFPIGLEKRFEVVKIDIGTGTPTAPSAIACGEVGTREGWLLAGMEHLIAPKVGEEYLAVFQSGGSLGGYWQLICTWSEHLQRKEGFSPNGDGTTPGFFQTDKR